MAGAAGQPAAQSVKVLTARIRDILSSSPRIEQNALFHRLGGRTAQTSQALQEMVMSRGVEVFADSSGQQFVRLAQSQGIGAGRRVCVERLGETERAVYEAIKQAQRMGVWMKDLKLSLRRRVQTEKIITRAVGRLEKDGLIKQVKTVANRRKTVLMISELEPHDSLIGGTWYTEEQEFDGEFVAAVTQCVLGYIQHNQSASLEAIEKYVLMQPDLSQRGRVIPPDKLQDIVRVLVYDGFVTSCGGEGRQQYFQATERVLPEPTGPVKELTESPCLSCPVFASCDPAGHGRHNPRDCVYLERWLGLEVPEW
eukprot:TRINITY_DN6516_c2_g1_i1.p1 TRINITY_DN6516_c2_g1~~TRINITY_DN6516_c2_g1_i1.p1  ORF type:complete len:311 (+),score=61.09 TRINITY_DN6516_c2_g1_i1:99-1031(+)